MPDKPSMAHVKSSIRLHEDQSIGMYRPINGLNEPCRFERAFCCECGGVDFDVSKTDEGWCIECTTCGDSASMLNDLINKF